MNKQHGFSLISILLILLLIASLSSYLLISHTTQQTTISLALQQTQTQFAAYSGLEWAVQDALQNNCSQPNSTFTLPQDVEIKATCQALAITEGTQNYTVYTLKVRATKECVNKSTCSHTLYKTVKQL